MPSSSRVRLLIVDDEHHVRSSLAAWLREDGYAVRTAEDGRSALELLAREGAEIVLADICMRGMDGLELQQRINEQSPDSTVIIMTAYAAVETAVQALKQGAYDYLVKPSNPEDISRVVAKAAERYSLINENRALRQRLREHEPELIFDETGPMCQVLEQVEQVAPTDTSVLLLGESGTGKEILARLIHARGQRQPHPMVVVNCGALPEGVIESELFGHERGAFTGAVGRRIGQIERSDHGTLFLDEIGDIPPKVQVDLLRVLQERSFLRVGSDKPTSVDFRLVTATHRKLSEEIEAGRFRSDLYFRINVFCIKLPALRDRPGDIPLLAEHFLARFTRQMDRRVVGFTRAALAALCAHPWPGNVRELQNAIERAVVVCRGATIDVKQLPFGEASAAPPDLTLAALEAEHIRRVLVSCSFNVTQSAKLLGIDRVTLYAKMKKYEIERPS